MMSESSIYAPLRWMVFMAAVAACADSAEPTEPPPDPSTDAGFEPVDAEPALDAAPPDADAVEMDVGLPDQGFADSGPADLGFADAGADAGSIDPAHQIAQVKAQGSGRIEGAVVTFIQRPPLFLEAGFYLQASRLGPALFVSTESFPPVAVGDEVDLEVVRSDNRLMFIVREFRDLQVVGTARPIEPWIQDLTRAADIVTNLDDYEAELVTVTGTITSAPVTAGIETAQTIDTAFIIDSDRLRTVMPSAIGDRLRADVGCEISVTGVMGRIGPNARAIIDRQEDILSLDCPVGAEAAPNNLVLVEFHRGINGGTVRPDGSDFVVPGLDVMAARLLTVTAVLVTTSTQTPGATYPLEVTGPIEDILGNRVRAPNNRTSFVGR